LTQFECLSFLVLYSYFYLYVVLDIFEKCGQLVDVIISINYTLTFKYELLSRTLLLSRSNCSIFTHESRNCYSAS